MSAVPQTPGQIAKEWAKAHADFVGAVMVISWTNKGKGGRRGITDRVNTFFVLNGKAASNREKRVDGSYLTNGLCRVCGGIYLDQVLRFAWADDPDAGKPVPVLTSLNWPDWQSIASDKAYVMACPACISEHGLVVDATRHIDYDLDHAQKIRTCVREHPSLTRFSVAPRRTSIDARQGKPYTETEIAPGADVIIKHL